MGRFMLLCVGLVLCALHRAQAQQFAPNPAYASFTLVGDSTSATAFTARDAHAAAIVGNTLVIAGGEDVNRAALNDVWISSPPDSGVFSKVNVAANFTPRADHATVVLGNQIIIMGGQFNRTSLYNDVWSSSDLGTTWTQIQPSAPWAARIGAMAVVYNNTIIMIGGFIETPTQNVHCAEVWSSPNGITWTLIANGSFPGRADARVDVVGNALVMTGGENKPPNNTFSEVWRSMDGGLTWSNITSSAPWGPRFQHTSAVISDQLIITTGLQTNFTFVYNDVWVSPDAGTTWTLITQHANFTGRAHAETVVYQSNNGPVLILTGGNHDGRQVWVARGVPLLAISSNSSSSTGSSTGSSTASSTASSTGSSTASSTASSTGSSTAGSSTSSSTAATGDAQRLSISFVSLAITMCLAWAVNASL